MTYLALIFLSVVSFVFGYLSGVFRDRLRKDRAELQILDVVKWQHETFPTANAGSKIAHLKQEVDELADDVSKNSEHAHSEFADCFLLLFGAAYAHGMNWNQIWSAMDKKMAINRKRKWGKPDANGVVNHIKN